MASCRSRYEYRRTGRGGQGITNIDNIERNGLVVASFPAHHGEQLMLVTDQAKLIRIGLGSLRVIGRGSAGVRLFDVADDEHVVSVAPHRGTARRRTLTTARTRRRRLKTRADPYREAIFISGGSTDLPPVNRHEPSHSARTTQRANNALRQRRTSSHARSIGGTFLRASRSPRCFERLDPIPDHHSAARRQAGLPSPARIAEPVNMAAEADRKVAHAPADRRTRRRAVFA